MNHSTTRIHRGRVSRNISQAFQVCRAIRREIRAGTLPPLERHVRPRRARGQNHLHVRISGVSGVLVVNPDYVRWQDAGCPGDWHQRPPLLSESGRALLAQIERIATEIVPGSLASYTREFLEAQKAFVRSLEPGIKVKARGWTS